MIKHIFYDKLSASFDRVVFKKITQIYPYIKVHTDKDFKIMKEFKRHYLYGLEKLVIFED